MRTVIAGFSHSTNIFSKLIMRITNSNISHAYIRLDNIVFQASGLFVNEHSWEYFLTYEVIIKEIPISMTDEQFEKAEAFRKSALGKPYSIREVFGFVWVMFMKNILKITVSNPFKDNDKGFVCSELAAKYLGIEDSAENITPNELLEILEKDLDVLFKLPYNS